MNKVDKLIKMIEECDKIVVFTGAGVSTGSGLKDYRSKDGLYNQKNGYSVEYLLSRDCFLSDPELFFEFYKKTFNCSSIKPNITHDFIKKLEDMGKLVGVVTQNIDGLHSKAGNSTVYEVHGTIRTNHCIKCYKEYGLDTVFNSKGIPKCKCGGTIKPDVVLYGESLPQEDFEGGLESIGMADMLIVEGTSLTVQPACSMINYFRGKYFVIINNDSTPYDSRADLVINDNLSKVSRKLFDHFDK